MVQLSVSVAKAAAMFVLVNAIGACASTRQETQTSPTGEPTRLMSPKNLVVEQPEWTAYGFIRPGDDNPEMIGMYADRADCDEAVANWMSRQVVGNPVSGECLPIDRR